MKGGGRVGGWSPAPRGRRPPTGFGAAVLGAALGLAVAAPAPGPVQAQYLEPAPRSALVRFPREEALQLEERAAELGLLAPGGPAGVPLERIVREGRLPVVVVPALFSDSPEPYVDPGELQRILFDGPAERGTVSEYYAEVSLGRLEVTGEVLPWVETSVPLAEAAGELEGHGWIGPRIGDWVLEALREADARIDFGRFDDDGPDGIPNSGDDNGFVDALAVKFLAVPGSCGGPGIWPHFGSTNGHTGNGEAFATADLRPDGTPVRISGYVVDGAVECDGEPIRGVAVLAHELGHMLGLPDWYAAVDGIEPERRHWRIGCFGLMGAGAWGCGTGPHESAFGPTHLSALSRWRLGWMELEEVERAVDAEYVLEPVQTSGRGLRVFLAPGSPESLVLEYRPRIGFDRDLPAGGVLIYHYDHFDGERVIPEGLPPAPYYHLVEADGDHELRRTETRGGNRGEAADVFAVDGPEGPLNAESAPSTRNHLGERSTLVIHSIRIEGGAARIRLTVGSDLRVAEVDLPGEGTALHGYEATLRVADGTGPYIARAEPPDGLPEGLEVTPGTADEARITGVPLEAGTFAFSVVFEDAEGGLVYHQARLIVHDPTLEDERLVEAVLEPGSGALNAEESAYLDRSGNENGRVDVGDLRARILRQRAYR